MRVLPRSPDTCLQFFVPALHGGGQGLSVARESGFDSAFGWREFYLMDQGVLVQQNLPHFLLARVFCA